MPAYPITEQPGRPGIITAYFMIYVVWGSTYYFIGRALEDFPPFLLGGLRFCAAGFLLLLAARARGEGVFRSALVRKSAVSGVILLFVDMAVVMLAQRYLSSSLVAIVVSSTAIWIMALDAPMWRRNFRSVSALAGMGAGFLGVGLLFAEQAFQEEGGGQGAQGILLLVLGCVSWAMGTLYAKYRSCAEEAVNNVGGAAWQMLAAGAMFWCWALARREPEEMNWADVPASAWLSLAYLVLFGSILAYTSYIWLLKVRPAAEVGTHAYVNPLVAVVLGCAAGGEGMTWVRMAGLCIILGSIALVRRTPAEAPSGEEKGLFPDRPVEYRREVACRGSEK
ncbi:EamA family transporter [Akkermansia muciniphila]|uniref:EamA family transporter n=1 Tax=Akkermansia muciniphila TaxID=239935 RepID=UPI001BFFBBE4|nr:EamA family transporter [Akkermansia muciniphila]MBT8777968.1 EamA family transporter [Akkermansia muciniphila]